MEEIPSIEAIKMHLILSYRMYRKGWIRIKWDLLLERFVRVVRGSGLENVASFDDHREKPLKKDSTGSLVHSHGEVTRNGV